MIDLQVLGAVSLHDQTGRELTGSLRQPNRLALLFYLGRCGVGARGVRSPGTRSTPRFAKLIETVKEYAWR